MTDDWNAALAADFAPVLGDGHGNFGFEVGLGWEAPLRKLLAACLPLAEGGFRFVQVKEKFGGLRAYWTWDGDPDDDQVAAVLATVEAAEDECRATCEECGRPGELREDRGWLATRCDECQRA